MPDVPVLETLVVENFRSIRGEVVVPLNAPVVLIHGPNGTGKSSLMTALALALAGPRVAPVAEPRHLVHHGAGFAAITLATSAGAQTLRISPDDAGVGPGALDAASAAFFAERCYLEQTKLAGLLKSYEEMTKSGAESALTRFVKELLRIDELDALVDGLHASGHVARVERELPTFKTWRSERPQLDQRARELESERQAMQQAIRGLEDLLEACLADLGLEELAVDGDDVERRLRERQDLASTARLETLEFRVRELIDRGVTLDATGARTAAGDAAARFEAARERQKRWQADHGLALEAVLSDLRAEFPRLPSAELVSPAEVFDQALESVAAERKRLLSALGDDDRTRERQDEADRTVQAASARLATLDAELADESAPGMLGELARLLAALAPHVADNTCPVCGRDYAELGHEPLSTHLAAEIARLSARAGQLQAAARARLETTSDVRRAEASAAQLAAQRLPAERRSAEEHRLATLTAQAEQLRRHERGARDGATILRELVAAEAAVSEAMRRSGQHARWLEERSGLAVEAAAELEIDAPVEDLDELGHRLAERIERLRMERDRGAQAIQTWERLRSQRTLASAFAHELAQIEIRRRRQAAAVDAVTRRMEDARTLLHRVNEVRRTIITGVFNEALNGVWADLFVRLAPDEEYVPAFCAPSATAPLKAEFETRRRDGTPGGKPSEMLSAGNLNTAALTLFLALHLSVHRRVPWLLLDDPVQSMDEIHVSQFAALLRTLTQQAPQRRVVIAVHERALFEYLALELSPASTSGGLITVELRRERGGGDSTALPSARSYAPDLALSAA